MSALKNGKYPIMLDKERHLLFSLNALDEVQDRFGAIENMGVAMTDNNSMKNIRWLLTLLLNEGSDDEVLDERKVGKLIHTGNFTEIQSAIFAAFSKGNNGDAPLSIAQNSDNLDCEDDLLDSDLDKNLEGLSKNLMGVQG